MTVVDTADTRSFGLISVVVRDSSDCVRIEFVAADNKSVDDVSEADEVHKESFLPTVPVDVEPSSDAFCMTLKHHFPVAPRAIKPSNGAHPVLKQSTKL